MKIALPYSVDDGKLFQHIGTSEYFKVYNVDDNTKEFLSADIIKTNGEQHVEMAKFIISQGFNVVICGGCGDRMYNLLNDANIKCYTSQDGDCDAIVTSFLKGEMEIVDRPTHCCGCHH